MRFDDDDDDDDDDGVMMMVVTRVRAVGEKPLSLLQGAPAG